MSRVIASRQRSITIQTDYRNRHTSQVTEIAVQTDSSSDENQAEIDDQQITEITVFNLHNNVIARNDRGARRDTIIHAITNEVACTLNTDVKSRNENYKQHVKERNVVEAANTTS